MSIERTIAEKLGHLVELTGRAEAEIMAEAPSAGLTALLRPGSTG